MGIVKRRAKNVSGVEKFEVASGGYVATMDRLDCVDVLLDTMRSYGYRCNDVTQYEDKAHPIHHEKYRVSFVPIDFQDS